MKKRDIPPVVIMLSPTSAIMRQFAVSITMSIAIVACTSATNPPDSPPGDNRVSITGRRMFPADNLWNNDVSSEPVDPASDVLINTCGASAQLHPDFGTTWNGGPIGIPYGVVRGDQARVPVMFDYDDESDPGPYPIPPDAPIKGLT